MIDQAKQQQCKNCKGTGEVEYRDISPISSTIYPCQVCKGTGLVPPLKEAS